MVECPSSAAGIMAAWHRSTPTSSRASAASGPRSASSLSSTLMDPAARCGQIPQRAVKYPSTDTSSQNRDVAVVREGGKAV
jgi:hypothetical protein